MLEQHYFPMSDKESSIDCAVAAFILIVGFTAVAMYALSTPVDGPRSIKYSKQLKQA